MHGSVHNVNDGMMRDWNCDTGPVGWKQRQEDCKLEGKRSAMKHGLRYVWIGHGRIVWSLSWYPGTYLSRGLNDGAMLMRSRKPRN